MEKNAFTTRQKEMIAAVAIGMSNKEIASLKGISHMTVRNTLSQAMRRANVKDRTSLVVHAIKTGDLLLSEVTR